MDDHPHEGSMSREWIMSIGMLDDSTKLVQDRVRFQANRIPEKSFDKQ
jgi:hypothetical protein